MDQNVYTAQLKKNKTITMIRLVAAALFLIVGIGGPLFIMAQNESNALEVHSLSLVSDMSAGDYAKVYSDDFVYTGIYYYQKDESKPTYFLYFVPIYGYDFDSEESHLLEVVVVESKKDYREDEYLDWEDRPVRTFKGLLKVDDYADRRDNIEALVEIGTDFTEEEADYYLPRLTIGRGKPDDMPPIWIAALLGVLFLAVNVAYHTRTKKLQKRMADYNITEVSLYNFEQEYRRGHETFGKVDLTDSWLFNRAPNGTCVLPLKEVVWLHQRVVRNYTNGIYSGAAYTVELYFSDKGALSLASKKKAVDATVESIAARCPQALLGYSPERAQAWKKDYTQIVRASREKAWEAEQAAHAEAYAESEEPLEEAPDETAAIAE